MKRIIFSLIALLIFSIYVFATPISESEAREKALTFMLSKKGESSARSAQRFGRSGGTGATLTVAETQEAFYVFNIDSDGGYVIVSGDDRMPDVLGYSYSGTYKSDEIPANMRSWLEGYVEQFEYLQTHNNTKASTLTTVSGDRILPMLDCHWDQDAPYNDQCPMINGKRAVTGCVATAMAQIMYYHQWPEQTTKEIPAYTTKTHGIFMPKIGITTIDWDNIISSYSSSYTEAMKNAISTLMLLCGCAVKMNYDSDVSGANCSPYVFVNYFGYDSNGISYVFRNYYSNTVWNQMIYDELKEGRPVLYSGQSSSGGHAFVIDGYDNNDYFHVNWGWGGYQDDYFLLGALNDYNYDQDAIIGIKGQGDTTHKYAYAELIDNTLTFYYDNNRESHNGIMFYNLNNHEWTGDNYKNNIEFVRFDTSFGGYNQMTSTRQMFNNLTNLSSIQGMEYLDTQNVTDMRYMFYNCFSLTSLDFSKFNTQNVKDMSGTFYNCNSLTSLDLSSFDTQNVTDMSFMFTSCRSLTSLDVSSFNTRNVTNMSGMFSGCRSLTSLDVRSFNTPNVADMSGMFTECSSLTSLDISGFSTENLTSIASMFGYCSALEVIYASENWSIANVESGDYMFYECSQLCGEKGTQYSYSNSDYTYAHIDGGMENPGYFSSKESFVPYAILSDDNKILTFYYGDGESAREGMKISTFDYYFDRGWNSVSSSIEKVVFDKSFADCPYIYSTQYWFYNCKNLTSIHGIENLNTQNVTDMRYMFCNCGSLTSLDVSNFYTEKVTSMRCMFYNCGSLTSLDVSNFDTQNVTDMGWMFWGCQSVKSLDVSGFNTDKVTLMRSMFNGCSSLTSLDVSNFNTENVTDMSYMFDECENLMTLDVSNFNTSKVTDMTEIFRLCTKLTTIDVSNFDTSNTESLGWMFCGCSSLDSLDVSRFKTDKATIMTSMFWNCNSLKEIDVTSFNTQNITSMSWMFLGCESLSSLDLSNFNTQNVTEMTSMFEGCYSLHTIYVGDNWNTDNVTESEWMFYNCINLVGQADTKYSYDYRDKEYARIDKGTSEPGYFTSKTISLRGDVNGDGTVNGTDIQAIINLIVAGVYEEKADVNEDGNVNGTDIQEVINIIVNAE